MMKNYMVIITTEDERYDTMREDGSRIGLDLYADDPLEGTLEAVIIGDTAKEIDDQLDLFEGHFYLLLNGKTMERIASGIIDCDYPRTEIEAYEAEHVSLKVDIEGLLQKIDEVNASVNQINQETAKLKEQFHKGQEEQYDALLKDLYSIKEVMERIGNKPEEEAKLCFAIGDLVCIDIHTWCATVTYIGKEETSTKTIRLDREYKYSRAKGNTLTALLDAWFLPESQEIIKAAVNDYVNTELEKKARSAREALAEAKAR